MRLSELLGKEVVDATGERAGHVHDVRLVQDGVVTSGYDAAIRVHGLIIGRGGLANRLGYGRGTRGPWFLRAIVEGRHHPRLVPWDRVRGIDEHRIFIAGSHDDLERVEPLTDRRHEAKA
jgi:sporulation protein YlmC with PRC-barrel domain